MQDKQPKVILISSIPLSGHAIPVLRIGSALKERGHRVVFLSSQSYLPLVRRMFPAIETKGIADNTQQFFRQPKFNLNQYIFNGLLQEWKPTLQSLFAQLKPNLVLTDVLTIGPADMANDLKIPLSVNFPSPLEIAKSVLVLNVGTNVNVFGLTLIAPNMNVLIFNMLFSKVLDSFKRSSQNGILFVNSFFGLEKATMLPPNMFLTGPLENCKRLKGFEFQPELQNWLNQMKELKKNIVYVSMGSMVKPQPNFIKALYNGLKQSGYAVVWSLKDGVIPEENHLFFVKPWLPQAELIALPETKAVITHCGWGGIMECISFGKPILGIPCFGDQFDNCEMIQRLGIGRKLQSTKPLLVTLEIDTALSTVDFTPQKVCKQITELCENPIYSEQINKLMLLSQKTRGVELAVQQIEGVMEVGADHLIDPVQTKAHKTSFSKIILQASLLAVGWTAWKNRSQVAGWLKRLIHNT